MNENNILPVILAGGKSKRFGSNKSNIKLGDKTLIEHVIHKVEKQFSEILIISNQNQLQKLNENIYIIDDCIEGHLGPLVGVLSAMKWVLKNRKYSWVATFPCDTPFFDTKIIIELKKASLSNSKKLFFIKSGEKRHNIFGLWSLDLINILENDIRSNFRKVELWADKIGFEVINIEKKSFDSFLNINTKEDFEIAKKKLDKI